MGDISAENPAPVEPPSPATEQATPQSPAPIAGKHRIWPRWFKPRTGPKNIPLPAEQPTVTANPASDQPPSEPSLHDHPKFGDWRKTTESPAQSTPEGPTPSALEDLHAEIAQLVASDETVTNLTPEALQDVVTAFTSQYVQQLERPSHLEQTNLKPQQLKMLAYSLSYSNLLRDNPTVTQTDPILFITIAEHLDTLSPDALSELATRLGEEQQYPKASRIPTSPSGKINVSREKLLEVLDPNSPLRDELARHPVLRQERKDVPVPAEIMEVLKEQVYQASVWHGQKIEGELPPQLTPFLEDAVRLLQQYSDLPFRYRLIGLESLILASDNTHQRIEQSGQGNPLEEKPQPDHLKQDVDTKAVLATRQAQDFVNGFDYSNVPDEQRQAYKDALVQYCKEYATGMPQRQLENLKQEMLARGFDEKSFNELIGRMELALPRPDERDVVPNLTKEQRQEIDETVDRYDFSTAGPTRYALLAGAQEYGALVASGASERQLAEEWEHLTGKEEGPVDTAHVVILNGPVVDSARLELDKAALRDIINPLRIHFGYPELKLPIIELNG